MKKIFGILSLIAILTVTFTVSANVTDNNSSVEFVMDMGSPDFSPDAVAIAPEVESVFNLIVDSTSEFIVNVDGDEVTASIEPSFEPIGYADPNETTAIEPINVLSNFEYGLINSMSNTLDLNLSEPIPNLTNYVNEYNIAFGSVSLIDDISTNVGKFAKPTLHL